MTAPRTILPRVRKVRRDELDENAEGLAYWARATRRRTPAEKLQWFTEARQTYNRLAQAGASRQGPQFAQIGPALARLMSSR
jgi:hypothetical protein